MKAYPLYPDRAFFDLDGVWDFAWLGGMTALAEFEPDAVSFSEKAAVPSVFDMSHEYYCKRGLAVYRIRLSRLPQGCDFLLNIGGMGLAGRIFWDGQEITPATAYMPYSPVSCVCPAADSPLRTHELMIAVDNRFSAQPYQYFHDFYDFYGFGGIYRSVSLSALPEGTTLDRVQVRTLDLDSGLVLLRIFSSAPVESCSVAFDDGEPAVYDNFRTAPDGAAELTLSVPDFKIWSPESPNLHTVTVSIPGDSIVERFGIRTIETSGTKLLLNGKELYLNGVNRHETHPESGPVQTWQQMMEDVRLIKSAGMNFIRSVHYPQDAAWLDLCDETGILLWVETLGWGLSDDNRITEKDKEPLMAQNRVMIRSGINHPSVIIWGMLNECSTHMEESVPVYRELLLDMKAEDPARLRSYADCRELCNQCTEEADIISINTYPGWFQDITDSETLASDLIAPRLKIYADFYGQEKFGSKPILISEIGACGLYGVHDRNLAQWSEEFQADYMSRAVAEVHKNKRFCGYALWQFCDSRSFQRGQIRGKPRGYNCAGLVDEYRRKKMAYDAVAETIRKGEK